MRPIFKSWGEEATKKRKSQSTFTTSFHLFDVSIKIFLTEKKKKSVTPAVKIKNEHTRK